MDYLKVGSGLHSGKYRPDIDGIRAIAVSSVVLCHAFPNNFPGGFIGVDIFFVISGYLITKIIINDCAQDKFSILKFYDRRIRRIFPALLALLTATLALGWYILFRPEYASLGKHVAASSLFSENFLLWSEVSYFDTASTLKPTLHLWSLAIEEQFYILWPLILYVSHRWRLPFLAIFVGLAGLSFAINLHEIHTDMTAAYYSPLGRSWELMIGSVLAYIEVNRPQVLARYQNAQSVVGLGLIIVALVLVKPESAFPGFWALLPTVGTFLLIACGKEGIVNRRFLALPPMVWCGLISYPLYLWHWFFLSYAHILDATTLLGRTHSAMAIAAAVVAAIATFLLIERPLRTRRGGKAEPLLLLAGMVSVLGLALVIGAGVLPPRLKLFSAPTENEWSFLTKLAPTPGGGEDAIYHLGGQRPESVLFLGDSHVAHYAVRLDHILARDPARPGAVLAIGGGCIPLEGVYTDDRARAECWPLRDQGYRMADQPQIKRIVIGASWNWYLLIDGYYYVANGKHMAVSSPAGRQAALDRLAQHVRVWQRAGKQVVFLLDNPSSSGFASAGWETRFSRKAKNYPANASARIAPDQIALRRFLADWATGLGVEVIDPFAALCVGDMCRATTGDSLPMYKDSSHFNPRWTIDSATFIDKTLAPVATQ